MRATQPTPRCPRCGALVYRTHVCRARPTDPPSLRRMPSDFRAQVAAAVAAAQLDAAPTLLDLVDPTD